MEHFRRRKQHQPLKQLSPSTYQSPTSSRRPSVSVGDGKWLYVLLGRLLTPEASSVARRQCQGMPLCLWGPVVMVCNHGCSLAVETGPRHFSSLHSIFIHSFPLSSPVNGGCHHGNITSCHLVYVFFLKSCYSINNPYGLFFLFLFFLPPRGKVLYSTK